MLIRLLHVFSIVILIAFSQSCKKDAILKDVSAQLAFSTDTLTFDTVFTTLGSATRLFKFYNPHDQTLIISSIVLEQGTSSNFRMNVDGVSGLTFKDVEILPKDSLYVFVEVTVDPNNENKPIVIRDNVRFTTNGNEQRVVLEAYGRDAHFYRDSVICTQTWIDDGKPYVIINSILVDSGCRLSIGPGVEIYCDANSGIFVEGSIEANGLKGDSVVFQGIRLEPFYQDLPGQWLGIFPLRGSTTNLLEHTVVKNSVFGVSLGSNTNPDLTTFTNQNAPDILLKNTVIKNIQGTGIFGFLSFIRAENCLVYNCGEHNVQIAFGGLYAFIHCTFANFTNSVVTHRDPIIQVGNFVESTQGFFSANVDASFINCIVWGGEDEEISLDDDGLSAFDIFFNNSLLKTERDITGSDFTGSFKNQDPLFIDVNEENFSLQSGSPAIDKGVDVGTSGVTEDFNDEARPKGARPDLGAYEIE